MAAFPAEGDVQVEPQGIARLGRRMENRLSHALHPFSRPDGKGRIVGHEIVADLRLFLNR